MILTHGNDDKKEQENAVEERSTKNTLERCDKKATDTRKENPWQNNKE